MILPFSTIIDGRPSFFVERILAGLSDNKIEFDNDCIPPNFSHSRMEILPGKIHTIREDKKGRWHPGVMIDFFINVRQKNMFRFAPRLAVVSTQKIEIRYVPLTIPRGKSCPVVLIDGKLKYDMAGVLADEFLPFVKNDGFDTIEDFFAYFNEPHFVGKIIHWTKLKY